MTQLIFFHALMEITIALDGSANNLNHFTIDFFYAIYRRATNKLGKNLIPTIADIIGD